MLFYEGGEGEEVGRGGGGVLQKEANPDSVLHKAICSLMDPDQDHAYSEQSVFWWNLQIKAILGL